MKTLIALALLATGCFFRDPALPLQSIVSADQISATACGDAVRGTIPVPHVGDYLINKISFCVEIANRSTENLQFDPRKIVLLSGEYEVTPALLDPVVIESKSAYRFNLSFDAPVDYFDRGETLQIDLARGFDHQIALSPLAYRMRGRPTKRTTR